VPRFSIALLISLLLINLFVSPTALDAQPPAAQPAITKIHVDVLEGQGQLVNIKSRVNSPPVVQVVDDNNTPLQGALVVFFLPAQGPSGTFANGTRNITVTTDKNGRAVAAGIIPNSQTGNFEIRASASYQGQTANATISQTNISGISASNNGSGISKKALIILIVAAGAVAGGVIAARGGGSSSSSGGSGGIVITPGTPTVGGPK
jgi:hypothetical protein